MERKAKGVFQAGFGGRAVTPLDSVPMASYGDDLQRFSEGKFSELEARAVAVTDENGDSLIFVTGDLSWCPSYLGDALRERMEKELGVPASHVVLSGIHTHASVSVGHDQLPEIMRFRERYMDGMVEAARQALEDRAPARIFVGSAITERMNFVRRYIMDDGSFCGDNAYGTGTRVVAHESQADQELQLMRLVREGAPDILVANFQTHPDIEGKTKMLSSQVVGAFRDEVESRLGMRCLFWNGAAGNINSRTRIKPEARTRDREEWARIMVDYAKRAFPNLYEVKAGPVRVADVVYPAKVNHSYDGVVEQAKLVQQYFQAGNGVHETAQYAWQFGINSYYHANRIVANSRLDSHRDTYLLAFSFGDVAGVVLPYEFFDTNGMYIKRNSPFARTFIVGYSWPAYGGYIPSAHAFANGGYEADNCTFVPGTAEELSDEFLKLLRKLHD